MGTYKKLLTAFLIIGAATLSFLPPSKTANAITIPRIYPMPYSPTINATLNFTLDINIELIYQMTAYQVIISWDPNLLNCTGIARTSFLSNNSQYPVGIRYTINNTIGRLFLTEYQTQGTYGTGVGGNATLFKATFIAKSTGQCTLDLHDTLIYYVLSELSHETSDGYFNNQKYTVPYGGLDHDIFVYSNSTTYGFNFDPIGMYVRFNVSGLTGTGGYANVTIPRDLLDVNESEAPGTWIVLLDDTPANFTTFRNDTHTHIYLTYDHSDHSIHIQGNMVVPEFSANLLPLLLLISSAIALTLASRRKQDNRKDLK